MMTAAVLHLVETLGVCTGAVLALGLVFERWNAGPWRTLATGLVLSVFAVVSVGIAALGEGGAHLLALVAAALPFALIAPGLAGPAAGLLPAAAGALAAIVAGLSPAAILALPGAVAAGPVIHALANRGTRRHAAGAVACGAVLAPATLAASAWPELGSDEAASLASIAAASAVATFLAGLLGLHERERADARAGREPGRRVRTPKGLVSAATLDGRILHYWALHERYGTDFAFLLLAIDDAVETRRTLGPRRWRRLHDRAAATLVRSVRATDTCAAIDFDRFGILLPYTTLPLAIPVAERVQAALHDAGVSASVGVADVVVTCGLLDVRQAAEDALYQALAATPRATIGAPAPARPVDRVRSFPGAASSQRDSGAPAPQSGAAVMADP